jgi:beta-glucosidase-like glycosyl hydrolase
VTLSGELHCVPTSAPLREKLAQLMIVRIGSDMPPLTTVEQDEARVSDLLAECPVGGLVVFNGSFTDTPYTLARLQQRSRFPLLIGADLERGVGQQLREYPLFPHAMAFDALGHGAADAVYRFAELTGKTARAAGVHITFGPVADVNSDPRNPIISTRAFAAEPGRCAELTAAFVRGCRAAGLLATAKHFPGHGDTHEDSHHSLPTVDATREELAARDLPPFVAAIDAHVSLVMTAHVRYPALDPTGAPATFSRPILTHLLRGQLGFNGAIITDSLLMEGAKAGGAEAAELALAALNAGVDVLLDVANPLAVVDGLERFVHAGRLPMSRVDDALARVNRLKGAAFGSDKAPERGPEMNLRDLTAQRALEVARRATVVFRNEGRVLPFRADAPTCVVFINPFPLPTGAAPPPLGELLHKRFPKLSYYELGSEPSDNELAAIGRAAREAQQFLAAFVVKPAAWRRFGLPERIRSWLAALAAERPTAAACLGAPQGLEPLTAAAAQICTYSDVAASQQALVERLLPASRSS